MKIIPGINEPADHMIVWNIWKRNNDNRKFRKPDSNKTNLEKPNSENGNSYNTERNFEVQCHRCRRQGHKASIRLTKKDNAVVV